MRNDTKGEDVTVTDSNSNEPTRRRVLRVTSAATVGAVGLAAGSGTASAGELKECKNWPAAPHGYPTIDLTRNDPDPWGLNEEEICIFAHGWKGREESDDQAYALDLALQQAGYDEPVIVASWASDTLNFWGAEDNADDAGVRLGRWLREEVQADASTTIRLVGHSLGARVTLGALAELGGDVVLETVSLVGAAVEDDSVCDDGRYADGIRDSADEVYSYRSEDDFTVCTIYDFSTIDSGLGCDGADCDGWWSSGSTPDNYHDVDVTNSVPGHCKYFQPDQPIGCMDRLVDDFE
ncbi:alpha/beta hydrolase [Natrinema salaciae]|uniref:DUF676 domain-containing protein n=1 Tax=Natrinema salaciae TaxID=1186196 RepID=A0A1H9KB59_9EURY|nr:alpha/beta hydrolase [Natrinema salaciae]SEQ96361.1 Alpha/beta hydrolase of unknown function [Natrinema salaciae]